MKKYFLTVLVAATLMACNEKPQRAVDGTIEDNSVENVVATDSSSAETPAGDAEASVDLTQKMKDVAEKCSYVPTGDINKDAEALVQKQLDLALKDSEGEATEAEKDEISGMLVKLGEFYSKTGQQDEFQKILGEKMREGIKKLKMDKLGS